MMSSAEADAGADGGDGDDRLARARSLLRRAGGKVLLRHDHPAGYLHERARWPGEYHLATVSAPWDEATNRFSASWQRNGVVGTSVRVLESPGDAMAVAKNMMVQVEDDENGNVHAARIADLMDGTGLVRVRWDRGDEGVVNAGQVFVGYGRRERRRPAAAAAYDPVAARGGDAGGARRKKRAATRAVSSSSADPSVPSKPAPDDDEDAIFSSAAPSDEGPDAPRGESYVDRRVSKVFDGDVYDGTVASYVPEHRLWGIEYDDGDAEEMDWDELSAAMELHDGRAGAGAGMEAGSESEAEAKRPARRRRKKSAERSSSSEEDGDDGDAQLRASSKGKMNGKKPAKKKTRAGGASAAASASPTTTSRSGRIRKQVFREHMFQDWSSGASSEEDVESDGPGILAMRPGAARKKSGRAAPATKRRRGPSPDDDDEFSVASDVSEEALNADDDGEEEAEVKPKARRGAKPVQKPKDAGGGGGKKSMAESFQPINAPPYFRESLKSIEENHEPLDPCGIEATDGIIEGLVGKQLDSIGGLLARALRSDECDLGSAASPLKIATACSGTDAPVLALTILKEQMDLRKPQLGIDKDEGSETLLHSEHVFSCEIDAFKQGYLARNFDSVLYPNICELCDEVPRDAWGRPVALGDFNLAVMGTSCKNFSTERTKHRIDIEDKGCSGETFLAAVELLFKKQPKYAILENVEKAPWEKMKEYCTGRVKLSNCASSKAIKEVRADEKKMDLTFALVDGKILTDRIPGVYGVRCGSELRAFLKGKSTEEHKVTFPTASQCRKEMKCTLKQLMDHNGITRSSDTLVFDTGGVTFCAHYIKVDTKSFGLPQTRNRVYMFVWQPRDGDINDDLGAYWEAIVKHLQAPTRYSLESFLLADDHDIIRVFREALRGPAGRISKRAQFQQPDFWESASANLKYNKNVRELSGIDEMARTLTSWAAFGAKQLPPHYWLEFVDIEEQRSVDMLDVLHASAARDVESHDSCFSSHFWNISQNLGKEKHRGAVSGVAGCITPGGRVFLPHIGRPLLGCEKLLLQGIPYFRLLLGNETEVQLGVLTANQLRTECNESKVKPEQVLKENASLPTTSLRERLNRDIELHRDCAHEDDLPSIAAVFKSLLPLASEAAESSVMCTCESSGRNSETCDFVRCRVCGVSCCRNCIHSTSGYQLKSHSTESVTLCSRNAPGDFLSKLQRVVPTSVVFSEKGISLVGSCHRASDLAKFQFGLHCIRRDRKRWRIIYYARADGGSGDTIAEFSIFVGEVEARGSGANDVRLGVVGSLRSFLPAKLPPFVYGDIIPCAKVTVLSEDDEFLWYHRVESKKVDLIVKGVGVTPSFRAELGINNHAQESIEETSKSSHKKKAVEAAKARGEGWRFFYREGWKDWPKVLDVNGGGAAAAAVHGRYERADCRQTINQSALWIRKSVPAQAPALYLMMQPKVSRNGPDYAVISSSMSHDDFSSIIARFPSKWQPCDALNSNCRVQGVEISSWNPLPALECFVPPSDIKVSGPSDRSSGTMLEIHGLSELDVKMLSRNDAGTVGKSKCSLPLNVYRGQAAQQTVRVFNSTCVMPLQQFAARGRFHYDLNPNSSWIDYTPSEGEVAGCDDGIVPSRPPEHWILDTERNEWTRQFGPDASRQYFTALQDAQRTFDMTLHLNERRLVIGCSPKIAIHRAARHLIEGRGDSTILGTDLLLQYRLVDSAKQNDPTLDPFHVSNCEYLAPTEIDLRDEHELYDRQKRALTKMASIEDGQTTFEELELHESSMPGSTGWSLIAKASRKRAIQGGVVADAIGAGKTVISIALILRGLQKARAGMCAPNQSSATLVVVPPGLIDQWKHEVEKFAPLPLAVVCVYDLDSLKELTVRTMLEADIVICPVDILESDGYFPNLLSMAGAANIDCPKMPTHSGQDENYQAKGVWVSASSRDPYLGKYGKGDQRSRNKSAHYTYVYATGIQNLRRRTFESSEQGVPLEWFEWERVIVDEIHESLCTTKGELKFAEESASENDLTGFFKEKNRRAGRELLGITEKDVTKRPLRFRKAIFGLTGTPLLDNTERVIELANLMGGTYIIGLSSHWRKLERESMRDIFLQHFLEPRQGREYRRNVYSKGQDFIDVACCRNKAGEEMGDVTLVKRTQVIRMTENEGRQYLSSMSGIPEKDRSYSIQPADFDVTAGHDITKFLRQNARMGCRGRALINICKEILSKDTTKIIVFADGAIGGGVAAREFLCAEEGLGCTWLDSTDSVQEKNKKIAWYQTADVTEEDRRRARVLVLNFEHAAGLNLQTESNNLILFTPLYVGEGGATGDDVADASTELQAIGRVYRPGQTKKEVNVYRIEVRGPNNEECLDGQIIRRNTDEKTVAMAVNAAD